MQEHNVRRDLIHKNECIQIQWPYPYAGIQCLADSPLICHEAYPRGEGMPPVNNSELV